MERPNELSLDDFEMIKLIGVGGFGKVFLCRKRSTGEILALKRLKKVMLVFTFFLRKKIYICFFFI